MVTGGQALRIDDVSFTYPCGVPALRGVSFQAGAGERVGLVGPNGAGKSSLFLIIGGILTPEAGSVAALGRRVAPGAFNPAIGMVFQNSEDQLFCPTVQEDVAFGARNTGLRGVALDSQVSIALEATGLAHLAGRPVHRLSGGEKRLACIAGALVMQPEILLFDEPSAGLDIRNRRRVIELIRTLRQTVLIASHDLEMLLELCTRVVLLDEGRIAADGAPREILANAALMSAHGQEVPHSLMPKSRQRHDHSHL